jgi:5-formyltetrahydrofolate cyclo-ligase
MTSNQHPTVRELKTRFREEARFNRRNQPQKSEISRQILARFLALPEYAAAGTVLFYLDAHSEVRTRDDLAHTLVGPKGIAVPFCQNGQLELFHLQQMAELQSGAYGILEPHPAIRSTASKKIDLRAVDVALIPGVAFDRRGARLGAGKGYYDKLLQNARPDTLLVGAAFECQVFDQLPMEPHDILMDRVITESAVYVGAGRAVIRKESQNKPA